MQGNSLCMAIKKTFLIKKNEESLELKFCLENDIKLLWVLF